MKTTIILLIFSLLISYLTYKCCDTPIRAKYDITLVLLKSLEKEFIATNKIIRSRDLWNEYFLLKRNINGKEYIIYSKGKNKIDDNNSYDDISLIRADKVLFLYYNAPQKLDQ